MKVIKIERATAADVVLINDKCSKDSLMRMIRKKLFNAWDIFSKNYLLGLENISESRFTEVVKWYNAAKDMNYDAISNPPSEISKYLME